MDVAAVVVGSGETWHNEASGAIVLHFGGLMGALQYLLEDRWCCHRLGAVTREDAVNCFPVEYDTRK